MEGLISKSWQMSERFRNLYQILETLDENNITSLYKVRHLGWNIDLMLKVPQPNILETIGGPENFVSQVRLWMELGLHPHIVTCYYVRTVERIPLVFTEYLDGDRLHNIIKQSRLYQENSQKSQQKILDIAIQIAWGLHYIHEQGAIHSDIRPENIFLTSDGLAKVTNLGLKVPQMLDSQGFSPMGDHHESDRSYCSPEQAKLQALSPNTDIWSWGLLLLEMFQGQRSWSMGTSAAGALKNYQETPVRSSHLPQMPPEVGWLLRRCFRKNPSDRPSSLEIASELIKIYQQAVGFPYSRQLPSSGQETPENLNNQALCLIDLGEQFLSLQRWEQALTLQPSHADSIYNRGLILWRTGQINDTTLIGQLKELPRSAGGECVDYLLSLVHLERDDCDRALALLDKIPTQSVYGQDVKTTLALARERSPKSMRLLRTFEDHTNLVKSVCISADGRYVLSGSDDNTLKLWAVKTGESVRTFSGHTQEVKCVSISGDGKYAISASWDKTLKLWDLEKGTCLRSFQPHQNEIFTICLSFDGRYALSGSDNQFNLWQIHTGECLRSFSGHEGDIFSLALSKDAQYALSGSWDQTIKLWNVNTGTCIQTLYGHEQEVTSVCFSADLQYALSGSSDHTLKLWQLSTGQCDLTLSGHTSEVTSVCLSENGAYALSGSSDHTLKLWQLSTGRCLRTFDEHHSAVTSVCLSPDNTYALSGSMDDTLKLWFIKTATVLYEAPMRVSRAQPNIERRSNSFLDRENQPRLTRETSPVGSSIARRNYVAAAAQIRKLRESAAKAASSSTKNNYFSAWKQLYLCLPRTTFVAAYPGVDLAEHTSAISAVALSQDGRYAVSAGSLDQTLKLWALTSGRSLRTFEGHRERVQSVCLSPNSSHVLSGSLDRTVKLWTVATGLCILTLTGHQDGVTSVAFSADGDFCVSGSSDRTIKFWHLSTGECLYTLKGHYGAVTSVCLTPDGRYVLSGSTDTTLKIWDLMQQKCLHTFIGHRGTVTSVSMSADGYTAVSGSADRSLKLWHLIECRCLKTLTEHTDEVTSVCLTPDGRYAFSGSRDQTVKIWQVGSGECLHTLSGITGPVNTIALSADGSYILCGSDRTTLKLWQLDWELAERQTIPWDETARPYLEAFLMRHSPKNAHQSNKNPVDDDASNDDIPTWTEDNFHQLLQILGSAGYGWLEPMGVQTQLETMAANWQWLSPFVAEVPEDSEDSESDSSGGSDSENSENSENEKTQLPGFVGWESLDDRPTQIGGGPTTTHRAKVLGRDRSQTLEDPPVQTHLGQRPKVTLTVEAGSLKGRKYIFDSRTTCAIGRGKDCAPQMPNDSSHQTISRYHCLLDINPPAIRIRDLNSKNGTFVNGKILSTGDDEIAGIECDLHDGDLVKLGYTPFRVQIEPGFESKAVELASSLGGRLQPGKPTADSTFPAISGYTPVKFLGQGRASQVYSVRDNETGQIFALKVMRPQVTPTQEAIECFQRDLENLKALHHPNIIGLHDYGYWGDRFFLTLEYCPGNTISTIVQDRENGLSVEQSLTITLQILKGFDYAHNIEASHAQQTHVIRESKGLLHGNLKPSNIFLNLEHSDNLLEVKLADYGLDKAFDLVGLSGQTMTGSQAFRPVFVPRQALNIKYIQTDLDIWAAAANLYFMLTGQVPREFTGNDPWIALLQTQPIPIRDRNPSIPKALAELIDLALVDKPHIHFKKAAAFKRALETAL